MSDEFEGAKRKKKVDTRKRFVVRIDSELVEKILRAFLKSRDK